MWHIPIPQASRTPVPCNTSTRVGVLLKGCFIVQFVGPVGVPVSSKSAALILMFPKDSPPHEAHHRIACCGASLSADMKGVARGRWALPDVLWQDGPVCLTWLKFFSRLVAQCLLPSCALRKRWCANPPLRLTCTSSTLD